MSPHEVRSFLAEGRHKLQVATLGRRGWPHLTTMWFAVNSAGKIVFWTYGSSQKIVNLRRDNRITVLVEDGGEYHELRGVSVEGRAELVSDPAEVAHIGELVTKRYVGPVTDDIRPFIAAQATKRVGVVVSVDRVISWDHRKLDGTY